MKIKAIKILSFLISSISQDKSYKNKSVSGFIFQYIDTDAVYVHGGISA